MKKKMKPSENQRLMILRELLQMSQAEFAQQISISQGALSQIETGKTTLSIRTLKSISLKLNVNCNWLVNGQGEIFLQDSSNTQSINLKYFPINAQGENLIPFIKEEAKAGYIEGFDNENYLKTLNAYQIPGFEKGHYRMFEIEGDSMVPTLHPREIVVAQLVAEWDSLENGNLAVIITTEGIVAKRVYFYEHERQVVILKSENAYYKTYTLNKEQILEIWKIEAKITSIFVQDNSSMSHRIDKLEADLARLKSEVKKINRS